MYGITVKPLKWLAAYAVYSEAGAASRQVAIFPGIPLTDPRQILQTVTPLTTNDEFGAKISLLDGAFAINVSHFEIVQVDNVRANTSNDIINVPGGSQNIIESGNTAKGWEVEFSGSLNRNFSLVGGYANTKTQAPGFKEDGRSPREIRGMPRHKVQHSPSTTSRAQAAGFPSAAAWSTRLRLGYRRNTLQGRRCHALGCRTELPSEQLGLRPDLRKFTDVIFLQSTIAPETRSTLRARSTGATLKYWRRLSACVDSVTSSRHLRRHRLRAGQNEPNPRPRPRALLCLWAARAGRGARPAASPRMARALAGTAVLLGCHRRNAGFRADRLQPMFVRSFPIRASCRGPDAKGNPSGLRLDQPEFAHAPHRDVGRVTTAWSRENRRRRRCGGASHRPTPTVMPPREALHQLSATDKAIFQR
jgi:hypothetical protein